MDILGLDGQGQDSTNFDSLARGFCSVGGAWRCTMEKRYWTGKELIDAGYTTAITLGELAGEGIITAWHEVGFSTYSTTEIYRRGFHSKTVIPFAFDLWDYAKENDYPGCPDGPIIGQEYRNDIEPMIFEYEEVKKALMEYYSGEDIEKHTIKTREKNNYLKVILSLAELGKIDLNERGIITALTEQAHSLNLTISDDTVRKIIVEARKIKSS